MKPDEAEKLHKEVQKKLDDNATAAAGRNCPVKLEGQPEEEQEAEPLEGENVQVEQEQDIETNKAKTRSERLLDNLRFWKKCKSSSSTTNDELERVDGEGGHLKPMQELKSFNGLKEGTNSVKFANESEKKEDDDENEFDIEIKPADMEDPEVEKNNSEIEENQLSAANPVLLEEGNPKAEEESHSLGKTCLLVFKVFVNTFGLIFLAEWGDRSQLATIVMASVNDVGGIILGSIAGHTICTTLAVLAGALIAKKISVRAVTILGGLVFVTFAIAALIMGPDVPPPSEII